LAVDVKVADILEEQLRGWKRLQLMLEARAANPADPLFASGILPVMVAWAVAEEARDRARTAPLIAASRASWW
jgi:hypothetical protein